MDSPPANPPRRGGRNRLTQLFFIIFVFIIFVFCCIVFVLLHCFVLQCIASCYDYDVTRRVTSRTGIAYEATIFVRLKKIFGMITRGML